MKSNELDLIELYMSNIRLTIFFGNRWIESFPSEYYDDIFGQARIGLWKACLGYNEQRHVKFSTYASILINNEICRFYIKERNKFYKTKSLQEPIWSDQENEITLADTIAEINPRKYIINKDIINIINNSDILKMYINGLGQKDIAKKVHKSQSYISKILNKIKNEIKEIIDNNSYGGIYDFIWPRN